jgi:protein-disulfide isomerase|tara:strand:+ start:183 stop:815 length:633 start_codon:yes stop_codon:yes gene_type:complete
MSKRLLIILAVIVVGFAGMVFASKNNASEPKSNGSSNYYGKLDSKVELTEFVDFQCEACYAFYPTVKEIKEKYKDRVKFRVRNFPITSGHQFAKMAAAHAQAAAMQGKFWEMHDKIFEGQKIWERSQRPNEYFENYAKEIGLDMTQFKKDLEDPMTNAVITADLKEVNRLGGTGTPTFVLNGKKIDNPGNQVEAFEKLLDNALRDAGVEN